MGMSVYAVGGIGIIFRPSDHGEDVAEQFADGFNGLPDGLICEEVGAYQDDPAFFLGAGRAVGWNSGIDHAPMTNMNVEAIRQKIVNFLSTVTLEDGTALALFKEEDFGLHILPYVS